ncbi:MAG TPA: hypothetical protein PLK76_01050 [bacterium]|nr:hypothetical protein [bacterium]
MVGSAIVKDEALSRRNVRTTKDGKIDGRVFVKIIKMVAVEENNMIHYLDDELKRCVIHLEYYKGDKTIGAYVGLRMAKEESGELRAPRKKIRQQDVSSISDDMEFDPDSICCVAAYISRTLEERGVIFTREEFSDFAIALKLEVFSGKGKK